MRKMRIILIVGVVAIGSGSRVQASFHLWDFKELFSNADGTIQFIELFTISAGQELASGEQFRSTQGANVNTYTFLSNTPAPTNNHHLLIATSGFAALPGAPAPDFIMPDGFLFSPGGAVENLSLFGLTITYANLPTDGLLSLAGDGVTTAVNSPTNFVGDAGSIDASVGPVPTVSEWGLVVMIVLILCAGTVLLRRRAALVLV